MLWGLLTWRKFSGWFEVKVCNKLLWPWFWTTSLLIFCISVVRNEWEWARAVVGEHLLIQPPSFHSVLISHLQMVRQGEPIPTFFSPKSLRHQALYYLQTEAIKTEWKMEGAGFCLLLFFCKSDNQMASCLQSGQVRKSVCLYPQSRLRMGELPACAQSQVRKRWEWASSSENGCWSLFALTQAAPANEPNEPPACNTFPLSMYSTTCKWFLQHLPMS